MTDSEARSLRLPSVESTHTKIKPSTEGKEMCNSRYTRGYKDSGGYYKPQHVTLLGRLLCCATIWGFKVNALRKPTSDFILSK